METLNGVGQVLSNSNSDARLINLTHIQQPYEKRLNTRGTSESSRSSRGRSANRGKGAKNQYEETLDRRLRKFEEACPTCPTYNIETEQSGHHTPRYIQVSARNAARNNVSGNSRNGGQNGADREEESQSPKKSTIEHNPHSTLKNTISIYGMYDPQNKYHSN